MRYRGKKSQFSFGTRGAHLSLPFDFFLVLRSLWIHRQYSILTTLFKLKWSVHPCPLTQEDLFRTSFWALNNNSLSARFTSNSIEVICRIGDYNLGYYFYTCPIYRSIHQSLYTLFEMSDKSYTKAEVAKHNKDKDMLIIVDDSVYNVSEFVNEHPGGSKILKRVAGKDATKQFWKYHNESVLKKYSPQLKVSCHPNQYQ